MNGILSKVRSMVSADKNRYQDGSHDLDLTYITERLIAMAFPADGFESSYRNDIYAVARFLKEKHGNKYMIFNLCSERGYNYALFDHQVQGWCGFPDHHAPPLALVFRLCRSIDAWLHKDPQNVAVIHCLAEHDMQVLTNRGFMFLRDVEEHYDPHTLTQKPESDLLFAAYNEQFDCVTFEKSRRLIVRQAGGDEEMIEFGEKTAMNSESASAAEEEEGVSVFVTAQHDMWGRKAAQGSFEKTKAEALKSVGGSFEFRACAANGVASSDSWTVFSADEMDFVRALDVGTPQKVEAFLNLYGAWVVSRSGEGLSFCLNEREDEEAAEFIERCFNILGLVEDVDWMCRNGIFTVLNARWTRYFQLHQGERRFFDWVFHLCRSGLVHLLRGVCAVSGCSADDEFVVFTNDVTFRDELVQLGWCGGFSASFSSSRDVCGSGSSSSWEVRLSSAWKTTGPSLDLSRDARSQRGYNGRVWCVSVPSGLIVVRRALVQQVDGSNGSSVVMRSSLPVVCGNCKAGKGRTGTILSSYMLFCGLFSSSTVSLNYFAHRRSNNMFGVSSPAQRRYVQHCADIIANQDVPVTPQLILQHVVFACVPRLTEDGSDAGEFILEVQNKAFSKQPVHRSVIYGLQNGSLVFNVNAVVQGDVQIDFYVSKAGLLGGKKVQKICFVQFHTTMCGDGPLLFPKNECDKAAFDQRFPPEFEMSCHFEPVDWSSIPFSLHGEEDMLQNIRSASSRDGRIVFFASDYNEAEIWEKIKECRAFSSPVNDQIEKAGYMCKQGLTVRNWKERWFILRGSSLSYYKSPKNAAPNGVISMESIYTVSFMKEKKLDPSQPYANTLVLRTESRDFVLCSVNAADLEEWAEAIRIAGQNSHQKDLMNAPQIGKESNAFVFVGVLGAQGLMANFMPGHATMRPYCVAIMSRQKYTTPVSESCDPSWSNQLLEFNVHSPLAQLQLTVWDDVPNFAPRFCGQVIIGCGSLMQFKNPATIWYPLSKRTALSMVSGSLHLVLFFADFRHDSAEAQAEFSKNMTALSLLMTEALQHPHEQQLVHVHQPQSQFPRIDSNDFVVLESSVSPRLAKQPSKQLKGAENDEETTTTTSLTSSSNNINNINNNNNNSSASSPPPRPLLPSSQSAAAANHHAATSPRQAPPPPSTPPFLPKGTGEK